MLKELSNKNIVQYLNTEVNAEMTGVDIIMEYVSGGSIRFLLNKFGKFEENMVRIYTIQLLKGLCFLHSKSIIHRDIKGANLLITQDGTLKLSDFGASKRMRTAQVNEDYEFSKSLKGSPY